MERLYRIEIIKAVLQSLLYTKDGTARLVRGVGILYAPGSLRPRIPAQGIENYFILSKGSIPGFPMKVSAMSVSEEKMEKFDYRSSLKKDRKGFCARYLALERWITRPLSSIVVRMVYPTRVTPNQLTIAAFVFSLTAAVLFALASPLACLLAAAAVQISLILDCADGMLARAKNQCSRYGTYFDIFLDRISDFLVLLGAAVGLFRLSASWTHLALSLLVIALYMLQVNLFYVFNLYSDSKSGESGEARALAVYFITFCGIVHRLDWIFYALFAETALNLIYRIGHFLLQGKKAEK